MGPITKATIRTSFVLGLRLIVQAGTLVLVARMLGPNQFGSFVGVASLAVLIGNFSTFGTHLVLLGEVAKNREARNRILNYAVPTTLIFGFLLFFLYIAVCINLFKNTALSVQVVACVGFSEIILLPLFILPATEELALEKTARSQMLITLPLALRMLSAGIVFWIFPEQPLNIFSWLYMATAILALAFMKLYKFDAWLQMKKWKLPSKQELKYSAGYAAVALATAGPGELDKLLAVKLLPPGVSGLYAVASRVIGSATLPVTALLLSALPRLFRSDSESFVQIKRLNRWLLIAAFIYGWVLAVFLWCVAPLIQWLFGSEYKNVLDILQWLCLAIPGLALHICSASILMSLNRPWLRVGVDFFGMLILAILAIILYPMLGVVGMALSLLVSEWGMFFVGCIFIFSLNNISR